MFLSLLHVNIGNEIARGWLRDIYRVHQRLWMAFADDDRRAGDPFFLASWNWPNIPEPKPPRKEAGFLFRIERDGSPRILVQSAEPPHWQYAFQNAPHLLAREPNVREFDPSPHVDQHYQFRLLANVIDSRSVLHPAGKTRTTRAGLIIHCRRRTEVLVYPDPLPDPLPADPLDRKKTLSARWDPWRKWLARIGGDRGFQVVDEEHPPLLMESVYVVVRNPGKHHGGSNQEKATEKRYNGGLFEGRLVCTDSNKLRDAMINGVGHGKAFGFGLLSIAPVR